ncbi:hypothetical protein AVEN_263142-1 [Araneus ventricosus]|uniref:Uncharacterized protein n=1 Tax=Araneus ventricosus TaxID=182803 RepID=A0A4Y2F8Y4_ARAVE|nr:hypothetical protein AVEN_263142-1 [Araneus ventricosus]
MSRFVATRGLFWDGSSNFEQRSDVGTTPELAPLPQTSVPHQRESVWPPTYDLASKRPKCTADLRWNRVSSSESSAPEVGTLPLGHRRPETRQTV